MLFFQYFAVENFKTFQVFWTANFWQFPVHSKRALAEHRFDISCDWLSPFPLSKFSVLLLRRCSFRLSNVVCVCLSLCVGVCVCLSMCVCDVCVCECVCSTVNLSWQWVHGVHLLTFVVSYWMHVGVAVISVINRWCIWKQAFTMVVWKWRKLDIFKNKNPFLNKNPIFLNKNP